MCRDNKSWKGLKRVYVEQGFREAVEPKGHCLFRFACEVFFFWDPDENELEMEGEDASTG